MISRGETCWFAEGREECERNLIFIFLGRTDRRVFSVNDRTSQRIDGIT